MKQTEQWLRQKYEVEGLSCPQIAAIVERDPKTVWSWLKSYNIETRARGDNNRFVAGQASAFKGKKHSAKTKALFRAARLADGHFPKQPDGRPYWAGKSGDAHPTWSGGATPERQAFYGSQQWKDAQRAAYVASKGKCLRCSAAKKLHVHHVIPFAVERTRAAIWNLKVLCETCHRFVHSPKNGDREFLPHFASIPINGRLVFISYRPKHIGSLPTWVL